MTPRNRRRLGVLVGVALLPLVVAPAARADKVSEKKAQAARLQRQIDAQAEKVSVLAERYNQARVRVEKVNGSLARANGELGRSQGRMAEVRGRLAHAAALAYVHGGSNSMLSHLARVDGDVVVRRQYLRVTAIDQREVIGELTAAREDLSDVKADLEAQQNLAQSALREVSRARNEAQKAEAEQLRLLRQVNGDLATLVAAEQARREAEAARRAQAALAARAPRAAPVPPAVPVAPAKAQQAEPTRPLPASSGKGAIAVAEAQKHIGKPYRWGGSGPDSFDCSGLTAWAWKAAGVRLSHSAQSQYHETARVPLGAIQPGDLLFFGKNVSSIHHNAIYAGDGSMIEASQTGTPVRYASSARRDLVAAGRPG